MFRLPLFRSMLLGGALAMLQSAAFGASPASALDAPIAAVSDDTQLSETLEAHNDAVSTSHEQAEEEEEDANEEHDDAQESMDANEAQEEANDAKDDAHDAQLDANEATQEEHNSESGDMHTGDTASPG